MSVSKEVIVLHSLDRLLVADVLYLKALINYFCRKIFMSEAIGVILIHYEACKKNVKKLTNS